MVTKVVGDQDITRLAALRLPNAITDTQQRCYLCSFTTTTPIQLEFTRRAFPSVFRCLL